MQLASLHREWQNYVIAQLRGAGTRALDQGELQQALDAAQVFVCFQNGSFDPSRVDVAALEILPFDALARRSTLPVPVRNSAYAAHGVASTEFSLDVFDDVSLIIASNNVISHEGCYTPHLRSSRYISSYDRSRLFCRSDHAGVFVLPAREVSRGPAVDMTTMYPANWFHFLLEVCGIFASPLLDEIPGEVPIIFNRELSLPPYVDALRFFAGPHMPRMQPVSLWHRIRAPRVYQLSSLWQNEQYWSPDVVGEAVDPPAGLERHHHRSHMRDPDRAKAFFSRAWPREEPKDTKIYLSRRSASRPRCVNEADLEARLVQMGFTSVEPQQMSFAEQVATFYHAREVAGVSGAAFANLVFCRPGTRVVCARDEESDSITFAQLAAGMDLDFSYVDGANRSRGFSPDHSTFEVDIDAFVRLFQ